MMKWLLEKMKGSKEMADDSGQEFDGKSKAVSSYDGKTEGADVGAETKMNDTEDGVEGGSESADVDGGSFSDEAEVGFDSADVEGGSFSDEAEVGSDSDDVDSASFSDEAEVGSDSAGVDSASFSDEAEVGSDSAGVDSASFSDEAEVGSDSAGVDGGSFSDKAEVGSDSAGVDGGSFSDEAEGGSDSAGVDGGSFSDEAEVGSDSAGVDGGSFSDEAEDGSDSGELYKSSEEMTGNFQALVRDREAKDNEVFQEIPVVTTDTAPKEFKEYDRDPSGDGHMGDGEASTEFRKFTGAQEAKTATGIPSDEREGGTEEAVAEYREFTGTGESREGADRIVTDEEPCQETLDEERAQESGDSRGDKSPNPPLETEYDEIVAKYSSAVDYFAANEGLKDFATIKALMEEFGIWKKHFLKVNDTFEDLHYDLFDIIEDELPEIKKTKRVFCYPIDLKNPGTSFAELSEMFGKDKSGISPGDDNLDVIDRLLGFSGVNVRTPIDLDFFLYDSMLSESKLVCRKKALNTMLLIIKKFMLSRQKMLKLFAFAFEIEEKLNAGLKYLNFDDLMADLMGRKSSRVEDFYDTDHLAEMLRENYQVVAGASEIVDKFRKQYFHFLTEAFFKTYNDIQEAKRFWLEKPSDGENGDDAGEKRWTDVYDRLSEAVEAYLNDRLGISVVPCAVGDRYDDRLHNPYGSAERAEGLEDNAIKTVVYDGFGFASRRGDLPEMIIKQVDVIVVNNQ